MARATSEHQEPPSPSRNRRSEPSGGPTGDGGRDQPRPQTSVGRHRSGCGCSGGYRRRGNERCGRGTVRGVADCLSVHPDRARKCDGPSRGRCDRGSDSASGRADYRRPSWPGSKPGSACGSAGRTLDVDHVDQTTGPTSDGRSDRCTPDDPAQSSIVRGHGEGATVVRSHD